ncbi:hypothetical protein L7F22_029887 [Adiantum nelumboides]|nr:hypothetical protein [Adiantum nelumboides]
MELHEALCNGFIVELEKVPGALKKPYFHMPNLPVLSSAAPLPNRLGTVSSVAASAGTLPNRIPLMNYAAMINPPPGIDSGSRRPTSPVAMLPVSNPSPAFGLHIGVVSCEGYALAKFKPPYCYKGKNTLNSKISFICKSLIIIAYAELGLYRSGKGRKKIRNRAHHRMLRSFSFNQMEKEECKQFFHRQIKKDEGKDSAEIDLEIAMHLWDRPTPQEEQGVLEEQKELDAELANAVIEFFLSEDSPVFNYVPCSGSYNRDAVSKGQLSPMLKLVLYGEYAFLEHVQEFEALAKASGEDTALYKMD